MTLRTLATVAAAALFTGLSTLADPPEKLAAPNTLIVHEWGTFTNFAGSDGVYLEYRPLVTSDLPAFVFDRGGQTGLLRIRQNPIGAALAKGRIVSRSRMETPVTYFYSDAPMHVEARVAFPQGMLTDFYPPAKAMAPLVDPAEAEGKSVPKIGNSFADWGQFTIIPPKRATQAQAKLPETKSGDHYAAARLTDSDYVEFLDTKADAVFREKFLFYRGVGNFDMPVSMRALGHDRFEITSTAGQPLPAAFLVSVDGGRVRFARLNNVGPKNEATLPADATTLIALGDAMADALTAAGLYDKESRAMIETWKLSWFGEDGTRLLCLLPQTFTDRVLPLTITPTPQKTTRVMVGRLETLTPEAEAGLARLIERMNDDDARTRDTAMRQLRRYGRFAEPALRRVGLTSESPEVRTRTEMLLKELTPKQ